MVTVDCHLHLGRTPDFIPEWWIQEMYRPFGGGESETHDGDG